MIQRFGGPVFVAVVCAVCAAALALSGGGFGGDDRIADERVGFLPGNAYAGTGMLNGIADADCTQWKAGDAGQRLKVIDQLGDHFGKETRIWKGARIPTGEASSTMDRACRESFASAFKLYKIYAHALTFRAARPS